MLRTNYDKKRFLAEKKLKLRTASEGMNFASSVLTGGTFGALMYPVLIKPFHKFFNKAWVPGPGSLFTYARKPFTSEISTAFKHFGFINNEGLDMHLGTYQNLDGG